MTKKIKLLLADHHIMFREGLRCLLGNDDRFTVTGEADNQEEALKAVKKTKPDLVLLDSAFLGYANYDGIGKIRDTDPRPQVVILLKHEAQADQIRAAMQAGALGCISKSAAFWELAEAIETVHNGESYISRGLKDVIIKNIASGEATPRSKYESLNKREKAVFQMLASGSDVHAVVDELNIRSQSFYKYRTSIMEKLDIKSMAELARFACEIGVVESRRD